ncbi:sigma-70 family RNA polymerase sigma factor [Oceanobacillus sp. CF4.6]|uniref:sigma-70 family RNA polymerase sigma factor n=1 Tax=Oceanobacillus sp. CF4.6 TaxID=3373080 RepID=UPI003EE65B23
MVNSINSTPYGRSDTEILQLNPNEAINIIMDIYGNEIKRLIYTYVNSVAETDDITQEVFVIIYKKLDTFQRKSSLKAWIYSIAINKCKDYLRSWQSRNKRLKDKMLQQVNQGKVEDTPEELIIKKNESNLILNQVLKLPIKYREVIILYYFKELSVKEISNSLHMKEVSIRTRLKRAREKLKVLLLKEGVDNLWMDI